MCVCVCVCVWGGGGGGGGGGGVLSLISLFRCYPIFFSIIKHWLTHLPQRRIYASVNPISIGSDNGLSPIRHHAII